MKTIRPLGAALVAAAILQSPAAGGIIIPAIVERDFEVSFESGNLAGQSFQGSLSYDANFVPDLGPAFLAPGAGFESFDLTISGGGITNVFSLNPSVLIRPLILGPPIVPFSLGFDGGEAVSLGGSLFGSSWGTFGAAGTFGQFGESGQFVYIPTLDAGGPLVPVDIDRVPLDPINSRSVGRIDFIDRPTNGVPESGSTFAMFGIALLSGGLAMRKIRRGG